ncbi:MAG: YgiQ family radical SAM protein [Gammaproteobacteria bacterium]|nr:MAG: YgiQ family radical SAM protein [Gammaproteobacteria bacterium]
MAMYPQPSTVSREQVPNIFSYRKFWAHRLGVAPLLPMSRKEMDDLGWEACDIILVTGDAYVDHPSFGMAVIGRVLEAQGFRVGIISQPDWRDKKAFIALGRPTLFFGVTGGNMDSMVNRYTSDRKRRSDDAYTAGGVGGARPDRAVTVYAQRCREACKDVPIILGGIEASLRRVAHYDYWSDKVRRSVLLDAKADMLVYGNGERQIVEIAHRLAAREPIHQITDIRGTAFVCRHHPEDWIETDRRFMDEPLRPSAKEHGSKSKQPFVVRLPNYEALVDDKELYAHASRVLHQETNPGNALSLVQRFGKRDVWINPPPWPLTTKELDKVFELPYTRQPHTSYGDRSIPAYEMIRFSVNIMRGCFGGCTFCSITEHEGRIIQSRSEDSIVREIETIRDTVPDFSGHISDVGGPTANMYRMQCKDNKIEALCRRPSCVYPSICNNLGTDHSPLIHLYRKVRELPGIKKVLVASGLRYDLAVRSKEYIRELTRHHVGGYLKIAPEHTEEGPLSKMMKPGMGAYDEFEALFNKYSEEAGKEQYLIPYFIAAHPGTTNEDMLQLSLWLKRHGFRADQVQTFLPSPMAVATAMYRSGKNPLQRVCRNSEVVYIPKGLKQRRLHKAFLRYHDANNWPLLRKALRDMGRSDLIGNGKRHLVPLWQPAGTGGVKKEARVFRTQHTGLPANPKKKVSARKSSADRRKRGLATSGRQTTRKSSTPRRQSSLKSRRS